MMAKPVKIEQEFGVADVEAAAVSATGSEDSLNIETPGEKETRSNSAGPAVGAVIGGGVGAVIGGVIAAALDTVASQHFEDATDVEPAAVPESGGEEASNIIIPREKETRPTSAGPAVGAVIGGAVIGGVIGAALGTVISQHFKGAEGTEQKFTEYLAELAKEGVYGYVTIKEALEECCGVNDLKQIDLDEVMNSKDVELDTSKATVKDACKIPSDPEDLLPREPFRNDSDKVEYEEYVGVNATWTNSTEIWKVTTSGWKVSGTLGAEQYAKGAVSATYQRGKSETEIKKKAFEVSKSYPKKVEKQQYSLYDVTVAKVETTYTAKVEGLRLKFPQNMKLNVSWFKHAKKLEKMFKKSGAIESEKDGIITAKINGKFEAKVVTVGVRAYPKPYQKPSK